MSPHILSLLLCLAPACAMALPTDSLSIVWKDSTQLQISFPLSAGDARPGSDYRLFVTPRLCSAGGDTLNLSTVEFAGTRNKKYNDRAAHLAGQARPTVYRADETMTYQATVPVEPWMKQGELTLSLGRERFPHLLVRSGMGFKQLGDALLLVVGIAHARPSCAPLRTTGPITPPYPCAR